MCKTPDTSAAIKSRKQWVFCQRIRAHHWHVSTFLCNRDFQGISYYTKKPSYISVQRSSLHIFKTAHWISSTSIFHPSGNNFLLPIQFLTISFWLSPRPISNSQLHVLLRFHLCPIYLVVFKGSYYLRMGYLILRGASRLDAFSVYPVPAWLLCHAPGGATDPPAASPSRSSRTKDSSSQISYARAG